MKTLIAALMGFTISASALASDDKGIYTIKENFIDSISKAASTHTREAEQRRKTINKIREKREEGRYLDRSEKTFITNISKRYGIPKENFQEMDKAIDKVPTGIIIGAAILESNWGLNEAMSEAKNPFGLRCFVKGCGMKDPQSKPIKEEYVYSELRTFRNLTDAVRAFSLNINANNLYSEFREIRYQMRKDGEYLTSLPLAEALVAYSPDKKGYGKLLRETIHENKLYYLDE